MPQLTAPVAHRAIWKIISPWLDGEILSKTFFLPKSVTNTDEAVLWVDKRRLPDPADDP